MSHLDIDEDEATEPKQQSETPTNVSVEQQPETSVDTFEESPAELPVESHNTWDVIKASFRQSNSLYLAHKAIDIGRTGAVQMLPGGAGFVEIEQEQDPNFDVKQQMKAHDIPENEQTNDFFADCKNQYQFDKAVEYYQQDQHDKAVLSNAGLVTDLYCGVIAGVADPVNFIPVSRAIKFGSTAVRTALEGAAIGMLNASERMYVNKDLTASDVALETVASGICSSLLYAGGIGLKKTKDAIKEAISPNFGRWFTVQNGQVKQITGTAHGFVVEKGTEAIHKIVNNSPASQMANSDEPILQELSPLLFRDRVTNHFGGGVVPRSVEENLDLYSLDNFRLSEKIQEIQEKYIKQTNGTAEEFNQRTWFAVDQDMLDPDPLVMQAKQLIIDYDNKYLEKMKTYGVVDADFGVGGVFTKRRVLTKELAGKSPEQLRAIGKLQNKLIKKMKPEELEKFAQSDVFKVATNYVPRHYDPEAVDAHYDELVSLLKKEIVLNNPKVDLSSIQTENFIKQIIAKLKGNATNINTNGTDVSFKSSFMKEREISIADDVLFDLGVLKYDPLTSHIDNVRQGVVEAELNRVAREVAPAYNLKDVKTWNDLKVAIKRQTDIKVGDKGIEEGKIIKENSEYNLALMNDVESLFRGTFRGNSMLKNNKIFQWLADLRCLMCASCLGQLTLAQIPDLALMAVRTHFAKTATEVFKRASGEMLNLFNTATSKVGIDLKSAIEGLRGMPSEMIEKAFGLFDKTEQNARFIDLNYQPGKPHGWAQKISDSTMKWSGSNALTRVMKQTTACEIYSKVLRECTKGKNADREFLNIMGITEAMQKEIADCYAIHGTEYKTTKHFESNWFMDTRVLSENTRDQVVASIRTITNQTILTAGAGDVPRFLRSEFGSFFYAFIQYPFILHNNFIKPLLGGAIPMRKGIEAIGVSLALSMARKHLKDYCNGQETDPSSAEYWREIIEYSYLDDHIVNAIFTGYDVVTSKYSTTSKLSPFVGWFDNMTRIFSSLIPGTENKIKPKSIRNNMPGLNFWYMRPLTNSFVNEKIGKKRNKI